MKYVDPDGIWVSHTLTCSNCGAEICFHKGEPAVEGAEQKCPHCGKIWVIRAKGDTFEFVGKGGAWDWLLGTRV